MAGLISWLGKEAKNAENAIGGAVHGAENYAGHAAQQLPQVAQSVARQAPQMISRIAPAPIQPAFNLANFLAQHSGQVANTRLPGGIISPSGKPGPTIGGAISSLPKMAWNMTPILPGVVSDVSQGGPSAIIPSTLINTGQFGQGLVSGVERAGLGLAGDVRDSVSGPNIYTNGHSNSPMTISDVANTPGVLGLGAKGLRAVNNVLGTDPGATPSLSQQIKEQGVVPALANATFEVAGPLGVAKGIKEAPKTVANVSKATAKTAQKVASDPVLNNEGGYLRLPDATGKQKGPQVSYKDGIKGSEISDKNMKVKPEGVAALQQGKAVPIQNLIDHKAQAKDYPTLYGEKGGVKAVLNNQIDSAYKFDPATRTIHLNPDVLGNTAERVKTSLHGAQGKRLLVQGMSKAIDDYAGVHTPLPVETQLGMAMKNGVQPTPAEVGMAHSKLPGELRASTQAERMNMSQRELGKNPIGQPRTPSPLDKVKQLATTGLLNEHGSVPIDPSQHLDLHLDEPTPAAKANLDDAGSVGTALGKTKAYIKRVEAAHKAEPSDKLAQHLEALKNDQKALQERYGELKPKGSAATVDPAKVAEFKKSLEAPKSSTGGGENAADVALGKTLPKKLSQSERQKLIDESPQQQTKNQVSMAVDEGNLKGAIAKATGVSQEADDRILEGQRAGEGLGKHDLNLLYRVENGEKIENVAKDAKNSKQFTKVATKLADAFDYTLAALRAAGSKTLRQNNYIIPHYYEASKELMDKLGIPEDSRVTVGPKSGFHDQHAKYSSYLEAGKHGLKPLFDNPMDAVDQYRKGATNFIRNNGLYEALKTAAPNDVAELGNVKDIGTGKTFTQAAGRLPFNATEEVNNAIQNFKSTKIANPYLRAGYSALKKVTSLEKATLFFGAPFHYVNITKNFLGLTMTTGHEVIAAKGIGKALNSALVPGGYRRMVEAARADGTLQYARESLGLKLNEDSKPYRPSTAKGAIQGALDNINPYGLTHRNMNHFIDAYGLELARAARKYGVKEGSADAVELGHEYNMILGRINAAVQGHNPFISKIISQGALAPQFARSQLGAVKDAAVKSIPVKGQAKHIAGIYNAGDVARSTVAGTRILEAAIAITASAAISGQAPTLAKIMNQAGLNPNNPNPNIDLQHNNKSGHNQVMNLPTDPLGLAFGAVSDPAHFGNARLSPALSAIERFATNQDWNGNQLADPNSPSYLKDKAIKSLSGGLPIGLQNYQGAKSGKLTTGQAVAQEFGGRVKTDPNDPNIQALNFKDKTVNGLPANIRDKAKQVFGVNQTGPDGKPLTVVPALHTQDNALTMIRHPELIDVGKKMNDKNAALGLPSDPFYGLSRDQQMTVLNIQADKFRDPAQKKALSDAGNAWLPQYYDDRSAFFDALNLPASTKTQELAGPKLSDHVKALFKIADPKARAQALATDPEAQAYFNANDNYINQGRAKQGLPSMKSYPTSTPYIEAQLNAKNFKDPQVQQYLNQVAAYNVEKGGAEAQYQGTNLSQSALKGVKNLGNYGIVQNPDGTLAIAGSNADAPGSQLARYGSGGKKGRKGRATKMAKLPKFKPLAAAKLPKFKAPKYTAHTSKLPKIAKAKLPVTRKLA